MDKPGGTDSFADFANATKANRSSSSISAPCLVDPLVLDRCKSTVVKVWGKEIASILEPLFSSEVWTGQNLVENGLVENGLVENGLVENGLVENGLVENGLVEKVFDNAASRRTDPQNENGPFLSIGLPGNFDNSSETASRLVWSPQGLPHGVPICVASSRLTRNLDELDSWFDALRTLAARMVGGNQFFVTTENTTTDRFVRRVADNFGIPYVIFISRPPESCGPWNEIPGSLSVANGESAAASEQQGYRCFLIDIQDDVQTREHESKSCPDRLLMGVAAEVVLLAVREGGKIDQLTRQRLERDNSIDSVSPVRLLISDQTKTKLRSELLSLGALGWWLYDENQKSDSEIITSGDAPSAGLNKRKTDLTDLKLVTNHHELNSGNAPILVLDEFPADQFLMHWTRRCIGPWPEQPEEEYLDDLLFRSERRRHGERSALCRILATSRILATRRLTRDSMPVVSFSNQSITKLSSLTVFRQHLGRWDFVPFGLAIERDWLKQKGAREVLYGDENTWDSISDPDRPFFQVARSKTGKIDWTIEKEWRLIGDLNLFEVPRNSIAVFVATRTDADAIRAFSRWPIVVLYEP